MSDDDGIDFALAVYREEGVWQLEELAHDLVTDLDTVSGALRRFPGDNGAMGLIAVDEDFFILVRVAGASVKVLLSDSSAAEEWELAESVAEFLELDLDEIDDEEPEPAGDLDILEDQGFSTIDMGILLDDYELFPDEQLSQIANRLGFGLLFDDVVGSNA